MSRWLVCAVITIAACVDPVEESVVQAVETPDLLRTRVVDDVYHHRYTLRLGDGPNARIRLHRVVRERAPWLPRATRAGVVLLHGDFSTFDSNFTPMATWLAQHGIDVWGVDRRWALAPADADLSDFGDMGFAQELDDTGVALATARVLRAATGSGFDRLHLVGFSRGGFLAYVYAAAEGARPAALRHVKGLVPLDVWAELPPEDTRPAPSCATARRSNATPWPPARSTRPTASSTTWWRWPAAHLTNRRRSASSSATSPTTRPSSPSRRRPTRSFRPTPIITSPPATSSTASRRA